MSRIERPTPLSTTDTPPGRTAVRLPTLRLGLAVAALLVLVAVGYEAYSNGWGALPRPTEHFSTVAGPRERTVLDAGDARIIVPRRAIARRHALEVDVVDQRDDVQFGAMRSRRVDIHMPGTLRRRAVIAFDLPKDAPSDTVFFGVTRRDSAARWRAVRGSRTRDTLRIHTRHFSDWQLASFSPSAIGRRVRDIYRDSVDTRVDPPDCSTSVDDGSTAVVPADDPPVYVCLERTGRDYSLTIYSNRAVGMTVPVPDGWTHTHTSSPSLGEAASSALTDIGAALPGSDGGKAVLLPATGQVTLRSSGARPAKLDVFADNSGSVLDLLLVAISKSKDSKVRAKFAKYSKCLFETVGAGRDLRVKKTIKAAAGCLDDGIPLLARVLLVTDIAQTAAANVDALRGKANGTVRVRFGGGDEDRSEPRVPARPRRRPRPPAPDSRRAEFPSCAEYNQLSGPEADGVLDRLADAYDDTSSASLRRMSVAVFCRLNSGRSIAGVYGGGSEGTQPATEVPTCSEYLSLGDADADAVLDLIATEHNDDSPISTRRLSAAGFCNLYPGRRVDGIYGGSG